MLSVNHWEKWVSGGVMLASAALLATGLRAQQAPAAQEGEGKQLFEARCHTCHELETATAQTLPEAQWREIVHRMIQNGAQLSDAESEKIIVYLAKAHGPATTQGSSASVPANHPG